MMSEDVFHYGIKALIRNAEGKFLLLKVNVQRLKNLGHNGPAYWDIPGGRIQKGDSVEQTLFREVEEETGIKNIRGYEHFATTVANFRIQNGALGLILSSFVCDVGDVKSVVLSDEHTDYAWVEPAEAVRLLSVKYPKALVEKFAFMAGVGGSRVLETEISV